MDIVLLKLHDSFKIFRLKENHLWKIIFTGIYESYKNLSLEEEALSQTIRKDNYSKLLRLCNEIKSNSLSLYGSLTETRKPNQSDRAFLFILLWN